MGKRYFDDLRNRGRAGDIIVVFNVIVLPRIGVERPVAETVQLAARLGTDSTTAPPLVLDCTCASEPIEWYDNSTEKWSTIVLIHYQYKHYRGHDQLFNAVMALPSDVIVAAADRQLVYNRRIANDAAAAAAATGTPGSPSILDLLEAVDLARDAASDSPLARLYFAYNVFEYSRSMIVPQREFQGVFRTHGMTDINPRALCAWMMRPIRAEERETLVNGGDRLEFFYILIRAQGRTDRVFRIRYAAAKLHPNTYRAVRIGALAQRPASGRRACTGHEWRRVWWCLEVAWISPVDEYRCF
jgi:hypothetical protein